MLGRRQALAWKVWYGLLLCTMLAAWGSLAQTAAANGFTRRIADGAAGPYEYAVGIWPPKATVGMLHIAILATAEGKPVPEGAVILSAVNPESGSALGPVTGTIKDDPLYHEIDVREDSPGLWRFTVSISSPEGMGRAEILIPVEGESSGALTAVVRIGALLLVIALGALLWRLLMGKGLGAKH